MTFKNGDVVKLTKGVVRHLNVMSIPFDKRREATRKLWVVVQPSQPTVWGPWVGVRPLNKDVLGFHDDDVFESAVVNVLINYLRKVENVD